MAVKLASLVCVYYPSQLIPALAAVRSYRRGKGQLQDDPLTVVVWCAPSVDEPARKLRRQAFEILLGNVPGASLLFLSHEETAGVLSASRRVGEKASYFHANLFCDPVGEVFFSHDISADFTAQVLMRAYPQAERVCFGDAWGLVYSNNYFESITYPCHARLALRTPLAWLRNMLARYRRHRALGPKRLQLDARVAILILANDPGRDFLPGKICITVERSTVEEVLGMLSASLHTLDIAPVTSPDAVLLVGSFAESRLCEESREIDLYAEVVAEHLSTSGKLLIKAHSAAARHKIDSVAAMCARSHSVEIISGVIGEMPIEVLAGYWPAARIVSFAYASVSLNYLRREQVVHAMNDALIHKYFPPSSREWIKSSNDLYLSEMDVARLN